MPTPLVWPLTEAGFSATTSPTTDTATLGDLSLDWSTAADLTIAANDLATNAGLETAVFLSLFTDRRADDGDVLPDGETDRRGWWADAHPVVEGDRIGSRLWLLNRAKQTADTLTRAQEYAREALAWLLEDRVSDRVDVSAEFFARGMMLLTVTIYRPQVDPTTFRYNYTWVSQEARRAS